MCSTKFDHSWLILIEFGRSCADVVARLGSPVPRPFCSFAWRCIDTGLEPTTGPGGCEPRFRALIPAGLDPPMIPRDNRHSKDLKDDLKALLTVLAEKVARLLVTLGPELSAALATTFDHQFSRDPIRRQCAKKRQSWFARHKLTHHPSDDGLAK